jgi:indoleacetamide hydrolase
VQKLADVGGIILGKANMHEMAFGITNNNGAFGPARNPYDPSRIPGGSSGGTGTAIGARLVPAGIGTDTGGSIRIPAASCGIAGLRPSSHTRDTAGPMARAVADCALLYSVMTGGAPPAPRPIATLRLGVPRRYFCEPLETEVSVLFEAFLDKLRAGGATLIDVDLSKAQLFNERAGMVNTGFELRQEIPTYLRAHDLDFGLDALVAQIASADVRRMFALRADVTEAMYRVALYTDRPALQRLYADCFADHRLTALIFPTVPIPAAPIGDVVPTRHR